MSRAAPRIATGTPRPSSRGAHALAWFVASDRMAARAMLLENGVGPSLLDRLLTGAVEPAEDIARWIARATDGLVRPEDWTEPTTLGWRDAPPARHTQGG